VNEAKNAKVIIICDGMPTVPYKRPLLEFFAKKGYWVFHPRYRGSWESSGKFLRQSPEKDILDVVSGLSKAFISLGDGKRYRLRVSSVYLVAASFGGPAGILASRDRRIAKVVAICPVVDWQAPSRAEPLDVIDRFARKAFGEAYRFSQKDWNKLKRGRFYNPANHIHEINGRKIYQTEDHLQ
jgi:pimeloyl-ACP methyl ester carboxylesterase